MSTVRILNSISYDKVRKKEITSSDGSIYYFGYNQLEKVSKDGKMFYNATLHYKPRAGKKAFLHTYTDMKTSFKQVLLIVSKKNIDKYEGISNCSKAIKKYLATA